MNDNAGVIVVVAAIILGFFVLGVGRIGVMQVREFRDRTGDRSWLTSLLGLTFMPRYHDHPQRYGRRQPPAE